MSLFQPLINPVKVKVHKKSLHTQFGYAGSSPLFSLRLKALNPASSGDLGRIEPLFSQTALPMDGIKNKAREALLKSLRNFNESLCNGDLERKTLWGRFSTYPFLPT